MSLLTWKDLFVDGFVRFRTNNLPNLLKHILVESVTKVFFSERIKKSGLVNHFHFRLEADSRLACVT